MPFLPGLDGVPGAFVGRLAGIRYLWETWVHTLAANLIRSSGVEVGLIIFGLKMEL